MANPKSQLLPYQSKGKWGWHTYNAAGKVYVTVPATFPTDVAALADAAATTRIQMASLHIIEATVTPPPPPPPPPPPVVSITLEDKGNRTIWIHWPAGVTPTNFGRLDGTWDAVGHDLPLLAQAIEAGYAEMTNLGPGDGVFLDGNGAHYTATVGDQSLVRAVDAGGRGGDA